MVFPIDDLLVNADDLDGAVTASFGPDVSVVSQHRVGGGCVNETSVAILSNGVSVFVKRNDPGHTGLFEEEARGLRALRSAEALLVPDPMVIVVGARTQILILEYIETGARRSDYAELFGVGASPHCIDRCETNRVDSTRTTISVQLPRSTVGTTTGFDSSVRNDSDFR